MSKRTAVLAPEPGVNETRTPRITAPALDGLTSLRFFAALAVVFFHLRNLFDSWPRWIQSIIGHGNIAVSFFFVLSGFVLSYSYVPPDGAFRSTKREFWVARFARIYPVYLLAFLLYLPRVLFGTPALMVGIRAQTAAVTLALVQGWTHLLQWNVPGWSLSCEAFFYAVFPFVVMWIARQKRWVLFVLLVGFWIVDQVFPALLSFGTLDESWLDTVRYNPLVRLPEFLGGICLARLFLERGDRIRGEIFAAVGILLTAVSLAMSDRLPAHLLHNGLLSPAFMLIIFGIAAGTGTWTRFLEGKQLVLLGDASYGVYILQAPVLSLLSAATSVALRVSRNTLHESVLYGIFYAGVLIVLATSSLLYLEKPARKFLRKSLSEAPVKRLAAARTALSS